MLRRIIALIIKEFHSIWRDPKSRFIIFAPALLQLFVFSHAATMEIRNINLGILNLDNTQLSHTLIDKFRSSSYFKNVFILNSKDDVNNFITIKKIQIALIINNDFSKKLKSNKTTYIQLICDGRQTNVAAILSGYTENIIKSFEAENIRKNNFPQIIIETRNFFNPNLKFIWFTVISLIGILSAVTALVLTSLSISRERELGTFDQLIVSPLKPFEILIGKTIPPLIIALLISSLMFLAAIYCFKIPFTGSVSLFYLSTTIFILSILGIGLYISSICKTQQQSILGAFAFLMPAVIMSGYVSPIENMPIFYQFLTYIDPLRFYLVIIKGLFLKDMSFNIVLSNLIPLIFISFLTLSLATWKFKKNLD